MPLSEFLQGNEPSDINALLARADLPQKGLYYWMCNSISCKQLQIPTETDYCYFIDIQGERYYLVYIGIGPQNARSKKKLRDRLKRHLSRGISQSTFRYSIAALSGYQFLKKGKRYRIPDNFDYDISNLIVDNFRVYIEAHNEPWTIESEIIRKYKPPLNLNHNTGGWHYQDTKNARAIARLHAQ